MEEDLPPVQTRMTRTRIMKVTRGFKSKMNKAILKMNHTKDNIVRNKEIIFTSKQLL